MSSYGLYAQLIPKWFIGPMKLMKSSSSDPNPSKIVLGLIPKNHMQALEDLCFHCTFHILQMSNNRFRFSVYQLFTIHNKKYKKVLQLHDIKKVYSHLDAVFELELKKKNYLMTEY